jgi:DNA-binding response OmpR family regulator
MSKTKSTGYKILIVEDEEDLRKGYAEIFELAGFEVDIAEDGLKGLEKMNGKKWDIVLLDLMMPNLDGVGTLERISAEPDKYGTMPIIVLTALGSDSVIKKAFERGASGYLIKTEFNPNEIVEEIMTYLE